MQILRQIFGFPYQLHFTARPGMYFKQQGCQLTYAGLPDSAFCHYFVHIFCNDPPFWTPPGVKNGSKIKYFIFFWNIIVLACQKTHRKKKNSWLGRNVPYDFDRLFSKFWLFGTFWRFLANSVENYQIILKKVFNRK